MATAAASSQRQRQTHHRGDAGDGEPRLSPWQQRRAGDGGGCCHGDGGGGLVIPAAQLPCDTDPSSNGSGVLQVGAQNICGWRCKMAVGTADTPEMQSEQLGTGGLRGHVVHLAVPFSHLIPCQRKGRHLL